MGDFICPINFEQTLCEASFSDALITRLESGVSINAVSSCAISGTQKNRSSSSSKLLLFIGADFVIIINGYAVVSAAKLGAAAKRVRNTPEQLAKP